MRYMLVVEMDDVMRDSAGLRDSIDEFLYSVGGTLESQGEMHYMYSGDSSMIDDRVRKTLEKKTGFDRLLKKELD